MNEYDEAEGYTPTKRDRQVDRTRGMSASSQQRNRVGSKPEPIKHRRTKWNHQPVAKDRDTF